MYERFTDRARKVMQLANQEAQRFSHEYIGTEHILLGLLKEGSGVAANVLKNLDVDLRKIRMEIERIIQHGRDGDQVVMSRLSHTPRAKKVIEYSIEEAKQLNHSYIGTEHLLLGLLREEEGVAAQVLINLGLKLDDVREEVLNLLGHHPRSAEDAPNVERPVGTPTPALDSFGRDLTALARRGQFNMPPGRVADVDRVLQQLLRSRVYPLVVGDREDAQAVVEAVAHRVAVLAPDLNEFRLVELLPDTLDTSNSTQVAERAMAFVSEAARSPGVWLAVRSSHPFGRTRAAQDANDRFRLLVAAGRLRVLWSMTSSEQAELFTDADLATRLVPVPLSDLPAIAVAAQVVREMDPLRTVHQVEISHAAVALAVELGRTRSGALALLDDAAAAVRFRRRSTFQTQTLALNDEIAALNAAKEAAIARQQFVEAAELRDQADVLRKRKAVIVAEWRVRATTDASVTAEDVRAAAGLTVNSPMSDSDPSVVVKSGA